MPRIVVALLAGTLFGLGLAISGMMNPAKVVGFLDVAGEWDPTLAFVMGGALLVTIPAFRVILNRPRPILADGFALPTKSTLDALARRSCAVRRRLGVVRVLPRPSCGCPDHGARAGVRVRRGDDGGDGCLYMVLRMAASWPRVGGTGGS